MARLEFEILGNNSGLSNAVNQSIGILGSLQQVADKLKIRLFQAETVQELNGIGAALTTVTGQMNGYIAAATKGSTAFRDQQAQGALDQLSQKLSVLSGNAQLFGTSIKNQEQQVTAYQASISRLLSLGFDPLDSKVQSLKTKIDSLTASINQQKAAIDATTARNKLAQQFEEAGGLIARTEQRLVNLKAALKNATDERDIIRYKLRITEVSTELNRLNALGTRGAAVNKQLADTFSRSAGSTNAFGTELGRIAQDAPYAFKALGAGQNNFGAIGNNITRVAELFSVYREQLVSTLQVQGQVVNNANLFKAAFTNLTSGVNGALLAINLIVSAYTIYTALQQKAAREAENQANAVQKQKQALDNYITTLSASARVSAEAASNYGEEVNKLDVLYNSIQRNTGARYGETTAIKELQRLYPDIFGNLTQQEFLVDKTAKAYVRLREEIINSGRAAAASKLAEEAFVASARNSTASLKAARDLAAAIERLNILEAQRAEYNDPQTRAGFAKTISDQKALVDDLTKTYSGFANAAIKAEQDIKEFNKQVESLSQKKGPAKSGLIYDLEQELQRLQAIRPTIKTKIELDLNTKEIKKVQDQLDKLGGKNGLKKPKVVKGTGASELTISDQLRELSQRTNFSAATAGLEGYAEKVQEVNNRYKDLFGDITSIENGITANTKLNATERTAALADVARIRKEATANQAKELSALEITEAQRVVSEVERIRNDSGVRAAETRSKELLAIQAWYDAEVVKAKNNEEILAALREGRAARIQSVNDKYEKIEQDLWFKINQIETAGIAQNTDSEAAKTERIRQEWEKRRKAANDAYDALRKLDAYVPAFGVPDSVNKGIQTLAGKGLDQKQAATNDAINKGQSAEIAQELSRKFRQGMNQAINTTVSDLYSSLLTFSDKRQQINDKYNEQLAKATNEQEKKQIEAQRKIALDAEYSFGSVFSNIVSRITGSFDTIFLEIAQNSLKKALENGIKKGLDGTGEALSSELQGAIAGAGLAGGVISGVTKKTDTVGQTAGGYLKGLGTGAAIGTSIAPGIGTIIGASLGGTIGAVGGLFGSKKAKKEEEKRLQEIKEEQKRQTELLRQQALAYTSSVIGKATTQGIVTGVEVNEFGELTAKISGKDLQFVLDRNKQAR